MVNWSDHAAENKTGEVEKVYGMMAGLHADNGGADVSEAAAEFGMMGISPKIEKWKESSKNLKKLINSSMSTRTKIGLGFKEYFGKDEVFDLSTPSVFNPEPVEEDKPLYSWFVKAGEMHAVPPFHHERICPHLQNLMTLFCDNSDKSSVQRPMHPVIQDSRPRPGLPTCSASGSCGSRNSPAFFYWWTDPALVENRPASQGLQVDLSAGWSKRPAPVSAGRQVSAGWLNPAARPYFRPSSHGLLLRKKRPQFWGSKSNGRFSSIHMVSQLNDPKGWPRGYLVTDNDIGIVDSGCSRSMTGNKEKLDDFVQVKGGIVKFGGGDGRMSGKRHHIGHQLDLNNVYYVEELPAL
ncbi:hypothetical protein Tco_1142689 [Tanacetum coccineum]